MKKLQSQMLLLIIATMLSIHVNAQRRIRKNHMDSEGVQTLNGQKNGAQTLLPSSLTGYYFEGFENAFPPVGWQVVDVLDTNYTWTTQVSADYPAAFEGTTSAYIHYDFTGGAGGEDWLITPKFTVAPGDSLSFRFKFEYVGYLPDSTFFLISTTDSLPSSFTNVIDFVADTIAVQDTAGPVWSYKTYSLNAFAGQNIYVAFKNNNILGDGVFIDNVELGTRPAAEASPVSIDMNLFYPAGNYNALATVKNNGGATQTFNVTMNITGGYISTKQVTLSPQASATVIFDPWNAVAGAYTINVQTLLAGDANPANDTISKTIKVLEPFLNYGWSTRDPLPTPTLGGTAASVCSNTNSRYFIMGGLNGTFLTDAYEYDLSFATWAGISPMPVESGYAGSAHANGKIFIFSGGNLPNGDPDGATQIYNYNTDTWTLGTPMPTPSANFATGVYKDSLVYIIGGNIGNAVPTNAVQIYNTYTDSWSSGTLKPGTPVYAIRGGIAQNKIVVAGGYDPVSAQATGITYVGAIDTINPTQIIWTQVADHPAGKISRDGTGVSLDKNSGLVVFAGGTNTNSTANITAGTFAYDVNSNSWKLGPDKPTALNLFYMTPVLENDSIYLAALGGGDGVNITDKNEWLNLGYYQLPTGITENNFVADANLFPNPANNVTTLSLNLKNTAHIKMSITDVIGNTVMNVCDKKLNAGKNSIYIQTKSLTTGIYFCVIYVEGYLITKKLFKN